jgi:hypothetical protein
MGASEDYSDLASDEMRATLMQIAKRPPTKLDELGQSLLHLLHTAVPKSTGAHE